MIHKSLAAGRWQEMTLAEQLGNVGSEYERIIQARRKGIKDREASALARYLELLDLTLSDNRWAGLRRRELARIREQSLVEFEKGNSAALSRYFLQFAILARTKH